MLPGDRLGRYLIPFAGQLERMPSGGAGMKCFRTEVVFRNGEESSELAELECRNEPITLKWYHVSSSSPLRLQRNVTGWPCFEDEIASSNSQSV